MIRSFVALILILVSVVFSAWVIDQTLHGLLPHLYEAVFP